MRLKKKKKTNPQRPKLKEKRNPCFCQKCSPFRPKSGVMASSWRAARAHAERGWGTQPGRPPWPFSGLRLAQRPPHGKPSGVHSHQAGKRKGLAVEE